MGQSSPSPSLPCIAPPLSWGPLVDPMDSAGREVGYGQGGFELKLLLAPSRPILTLLSLLLKAPWTPQQSTSHGSPVEHGPARCPLPSAFESHRWSHASPSAPRRTIPLARSQDAAPAAPGFPQRHQKVSVQVTAAHPRGTVSPVTPNQAAGSGQICLQTHHGARVRSLRAPETICSHLLWSPRLPRPPQGQLRWRVAPRAAWYLSDTKAETACPRIHLSHQVRPRSLAGIAPLGIPETGTPRRGWMQEHRGERPLR